ncbi:MAG: GntR family transcriptional regulator [Pseudomonadota bacterium]
MDLTLSVKRTTLHEELVERLRTMIVQDILKPGEKVPEKDLCARFDVSRTPLREALKVLASEGLVVLQPNRGARVSGVTQKEIEDTIPVLAALEHLVGELACKKLDHVGLAQIEKRHAAMVKAFQSADRQAYFRANQDIHNALLEAAGNEVLAAQHRVVAARVRRARFMANLSDERWIQAINEHEQIMDMLRVRDATGLAGILKRHMVNSLTAHLNAAKSEGSAEALA